MGPGQIHVGITGSMDARGRRSAGGRTDSQIDFGSGHPGFQVGPQPAAAGACRAEFIMGDLFSDFDDFGGTCPV